MLWHSWFSVVFGFICLSLKDGFDHKSLSLVITVEECCQWCVMKAGLLPTSLCVPSFPRACPWLSDLNMSTHCSGLWVNSSRVGCSARAIGGGGVGQGYASLAASNAASQFLILMIALGSPWLLVSCGPADAEFGAFLEPAPSCRAGEWCSPCMFWAMGSSVNSGLSAFRLSRIPQTLWSAENFLVFYNCYNSIFTYINTYIFF